MKRVMDFIGEALAWSMIGVGIMTLLNGCASTNKCEESFANAYILGKRDCLREIHGERTPAWDILRCSLNLSEDYDDQ